MASKKVSSAITVSAAAAKLASVGASKGGKARAAKLSDGRRAAIARQGGKAKARKGK